MTNGGHAHHEVIHTLSSREMVDSVRLAHDRDPRIFNIRLYSKPSEYHAGNILDLVYVSVTTFTRSSFSLIGLDLHKTNVSDGEIRRLTRLSTTAICSLTSFSSEPPTTFQI